MSKPQIPARAGMARVAPWADLVHAGFLVAWLASLLTACLQPPAAATAHWADGLTLGLAGLMLLRGLARQLPWQNVVAAAFLIVVLSMGLFLGSSVAAWGFGRWYDPLKYGPGSRTLPSVPFLVVWTVSVLSGYGVAQWLLRCSRGNPYHGWWLIGLGSLCAVLLGLAWEPYAAQLRGYYPGFTDGVAAQSGLPPWTCLAGRFCAALVSLLLATPWLIDKRRQEPPVDDCGPLMVSIALLVLSGAAVLSNC